MAFLCPSQLTVKKKVLQGKTSIPPRDSYQINGRTAENSTSEYKSALKSPSTSTDSSQRTNEQRTVRIKEVQHESSTERKIKAATSTKPANIRAKISREFVSNVDEELDVKKGQYVVILYQQHDWVFVKDSSGNEGFVPFVYCSTFNVSSESKSSTSGYEESFEGSDDVEQDIRKHKHKPRPRTKTTYFPKRPYGPQMTVLYNYKAKFENDVRVRRGESVMLLNDQDPEWLWVATDDGEEGFVPRAYLISHTCEGCRKTISRKPSKSKSNPELNSSDTTPTSISSIDKTSEQSSQPTSNSSAQDRNYSTIKGSKLIALYDFEGKAFDDLNVLAGEYVYTNLKDQIVPHWVWAYSPYRKRSGFIPEDYLKEPIITDI